MLEDLVSSLRCDISNLKQRNADTEAELEREKSRFDRDTNFLKSQCESLETRYQNSLEDKEEESRKFEKQFREIHNSEVLAREQQIKTHYQAKVRQSDEKVARLEQIIARGTERMETSEKYGRVVSKKCGDLEYDNGCLTMKVNNLTKELNSAKEIRDKLTVDLEKSILKYNEVKEERDRIKIDTGAELRLEQDYASDVNAAMRHLNFTQRQKEQRMSDLERKLSYQGKYTELSRQYKTILRTYEDSLEKINELEDKIASFSSQTDDQETEMKKKKQKQKSGGGVFGGGGAGEFSESFDVRRFEIEDLRKEVRKMRDERDQARLDHHQYVFQHHKDVVQVEKEKQKEKDYNRHSATTTATTQTEGDEAVVNEEKYYCAKCRNPCRASSSTSSSTSVPLSDIAAESSSSSSSLFSSSSSLCQRNYDPPPSMTPIRDRGSMADILGIRVQQQSRRGDGSSSSFAGSIGSYNRTPKTASRVPHQQQQQQHHQLTSSDSSVNRSNRNNMEKPPYSSSGGVVVGGQPPEKIQKSSPLKSILKMASSPSVHTSIATSNNNNNNDNNNKSSTATTELGVGTVTGVVGGPRRISADRGIGTRRRSTTPIPPLQKQVEQQQQQPTKPNRHQQQHHYRQPSSSSVISSVDCNNTAEKSIFSSSSSSSLSSGSNRHLVNNSASNSYSSDNNFASYYDEEGMSDHHSEIKCNDDGGCEQQ